MAATETVLPKQIGRRSRRFAVGEPPLDSIPQPYTLFLLFWIVSGCLVPTARATELKPETAAAFKRYVTATEAQMNGDAGLAQFLVVDRLPDAMRQSAYDQLQQGQVYVQELRTREEGQSILIPSGLVHHWAGVIFIPKGTLSEAMAVLQDYDDQPKIYSPDVRKAKLMDQHGDDSEIYEQFYSKSIVSVVLNAYFDVVVTRMGSTRCQSVSRSTRIVEVVDPEGPDEHERADGNDHGYMWRLDSYWRIEEKDGGVYVQNESISVSRTIPFLFAWIIEPLTKSVPRELLIRMLTNTRNAVQSGAVKPKPESRKEEPSRSSSTPVR